MGKKIGAWCTGVACVVAVVVACVGCSSEPVSTDEDVTESANSTDDSAAEEDIDWDALYKELDELDHVNIAYSTQDAMAEINRLSADLSSAGVHSSWFSSLGAFALSVPRAEAEKAVEIAKMHDREGIEIVESDWPSTYGKRPGAAQPGEDDQPSVGEPASDFEDGQGEPSPISETVSATIPG
ncbi:MAG: hypothetical protein IH944_14270 [Armatimonadetes bacterium]|nr:hypothetical protein [Armatimonadota bacterium]